MMHDLTQSWKELCVKYKLRLNDSNNSTIIADNVLSSGTTVQKNSILLECICMILNKYHLTWKLKKC